MQRRQVLQSLLATAAITAWQRTFGQAAAASSPTATTVASSWATTTPFTLGVASGSPRADSVVIWTRLLPSPRQPAHGLPPGPITVTWQWATDAEFTQQLRTGTALALPERGHAVHVKVGGLPANTRGYYRFIVNQHVSPTGRTRTAPASNQAVPRLRMAVASCQHYQQGYFAAYRDMLNQDLDLVVFLGDYIYENNRGTVRQHETTVAPTDLVSYRDRYVTYRLDPSLQACHIAYPWLMMWDDHEVRNDYAGLASQERLSAQEFLKIRTAAYQAYFEHMPVDPTIAPDWSEMQLYGHWNWGTLADIILLDERQYRHPQACDPRIGYGGGRVLWGCDEFEAPQRSMLGLQQEQWLDQTLADSRTQWRILGHGTPLMPQNIKLPFFSTRVSYSDGWDGYAAAQRRLLDLIATTANAAAHRPDTLSIAGDVHRHMAANLRAIPHDEQSPIIGAELICTSIASPGISRAWTRAVKSSNPDILHANSDHRGYLLMDVTPQAIIGNMRATAGDIVYNPNESLTTQATFVMKRHRPGLQRLE